ncbi:formylglycine-generating enzyme family protein [Desulfococcaceae bacterium HSG9]|nr:formylglycine-generating enzyme family protein [Desulfococcaceae bacterium HSG9]
MKSPATIPKNGLSFTGRADLLSFLHHNGETGLDCMAEFSGYERKQRQPEKASPTKVAHSILAMPYFSEDHHFDETITKMPFWRVKSKRRIQPEEIVSVEPEWAKGDDGFAPGEVRADYTKKPPSLIPLVSWFRLWPFLKKALGRDHLSNDLDIPKILENITRFEPLKKLPVKSRFGWDALGCLILDLDDRLLPVWGDINQVCNGIEKLRGKSGLSVYMIENGPAETFRKRDKRYDPVADFKFPEPFTPVLILSDLGCLEKTGLLVKQWLDFGKRLNRAGICPVVLNPASPVHWDNRLTRHYSIVWWDRGNRNIRPRRAKSYDSVEKIKAIEQEDTRAMRLLYLLAPAIRVEPELLRAVRMLLPMDEADGAAEILAWNHVSVLRSYIAFTFDKEVRKLYRDKFIEKFDKELREKVIDLIEKYHDHLSPVIQCEENITSKWAREFIERHFRTIFRREHDFYWEQLTQWFHRVSDRLHPDEWQKSDALTSCWVLINRDLLEKGQVTPPEGLDLNRAAWLRDVEKTPQLYRLFQQGAVFRVVHNDVAKKKYSGGFETGSRIAELLARHNNLMVACDHESGVRPVILEPEKETSISIPSQGVLTLSTDYDEIVLETVKRPDWANSMGRDRHGLFAEFIVKGVVHRLRWIGAGTFMMGSPEDEPERLNSELLHEVVLSQGFWIGETACTQELWESVMGANPSRFKGAKRPMENVSWNHCQAFIKKINAMLPGLDLRLSTEAEWEYACRAGTQTPFSFGDNITTDQVNYDGDNPYAGGPRGKYRKGTVEAGSLPCNQWGLYEMHGNVWEWCNDWYEENPSGPVTDPVGPEGGGYRVLRGGSWISLAEFARSARRSRFEPGHRSPRTGLRFARGHQEEESLTEPKEKM